MNSLEQDKSLLIGSPEAIQALAQKQTARLLVVSDSHGVSSIIEDIVNARGQNCDAMVFCGDGVCDIAYVTERARSDSSLAQKLPPVIAFVQGNGDPSDFPFGTEMFDVPAVQMFTAAGKKIFVTHGHRFQISYGTQELEKEAVKHNCSAVFFGHTHIAWAMYKTSAFILNPGSCARPRGGQPMTFAEVTLNADKDYPVWEFYQYSYSEPITGFFPNI